MSTLNRQEFNYLRDLFAAHTGIDFNDRAKLERLLNRRAVRINCKSLREYLKRLKKDKKELVYAIEAITINETLFFRNSDQFDLIKKYFSQTIGTDPFRIWSVAASTGQEPYSLAMLACDLGYTNVRIMATDINRTVLEYAASGLYSQAEISRTEPDYMSCITRYTEKTTTGYRIKDCIKNMVTFKNFNLINLTPVSFKNPLDMIICKNVFIYFTAETREHLFDCFYKLLKKNGALFLGLCESMPPKYHRRFKPLKKGAHIRL